MKTFMRLIFICMICSFAPAATAQDVEWQKTFGGTGEDHGYCIDRTNDGGFVVVGDKESISGDRDAWLIKLDSSGNKQWDVSFGGPEENHAGGVDQTSDGGYIIIGEKYEPSDVWLIRTNSSGNQLWEKTFGGPGYDYGGCVEQTSDGGFILGASKESSTVDNDFWLIKTDANGNLQWDKMYGTAGWDHEPGVQQTADGGYILAGQASSDILLIKTDVSGNKQWEKVFGGPGADGGDIVNVRQTSDGGYVIVAHTMSFGSGSGDAWLIKTYSNGTKEWDKTFGGAEWDDGVDVQQTSDGGYIIVGETESYEAGFGDMWFIKTDSAGNMEWDSVVGGADNDYGLSVVVANDGGYVACGRTHSFGAGSSDVWVVKVKETGGSQQTLTFSSIAAHDGTVMESTTSSNVGGTNNSTAAIATALRMGDDYGTSQGERQYKAIVSFDTSSIPDAAAIVSAKLKVTGGGIAGTNPLNTHGPCYVDIRRGYFGNSLSLENNDFEAAATATKVATMPAPPPGSRVSTGTLNSAGLAGINKLGYTQMRLYFSVDDNNDYNDDYVGCYSGESYTTANRPTLEVTYQE